MNLDHKIMQRPAWGYKFSQEIFPPLTIQCSVFDMQVALPRHFALPVSLYFTPTWRSGFCLVVSNMDPFMRFSIVELEDMTKETGVSKIW